MNGYRRTASNIPGGRCQSKTTNRNCWILDSFRESVFRRDGYRCVICGRGEPPLDAHHIIERRLWDDGGYYIRNGATLCDDREGRSGCHREAEQTILSCEEIRAAAGIRQVALPDHLYRDAVYDKWGTLSTRTAHGRKANSSEMSLSARCWRPPGCSRYSGIG